MNAVVLVGGGGTRLRPLTYAIPKPLIPVINQPLIVHILGNLRRHDVTNVVFAASEADRRIEEAIGDGSQLGLSVSYSYESTPLGSGLAVKQAAQGFDGPFFVCNGDVITDVDLSAMAANHRKRNATLSIFLGKVDDPSAFGVAELGEDDRIVRFVEKPPRGEAPSNWANAGTWLFDPAVLDYIPDERMDRSLEQLVFPTVIAEGRLVLGFRDPAYWIDVGTSERYLQLHRDILGGKPAGWLTRALTNGATSDISADAEIGQPVVLGTGCRVGSLVILSGPCVLGDGCVIGDRSAVTRSILWSNVEVGEDAQIRDSIIGEGCSIGAGSYVEGAVMANGSRIGAGVRLSHGARLEPGEVA